MITSCIFCVKWTFLDNSVQLRIVRVWGLNNDAIHSISKYSLFRHRRSQLCAALASPYGVDAALDGVGRARVGGEHRGQTVCDVLGVGHVQRVRRYLQTPRWVGL